MVTAGVDARIYNLSLGGFDTRSNQLNPQGNLLKQLSEGIAAFQSDLTDHQLDKDVVIMTFSEFGRRVAQNNGNGTDHGTAEPMFIVGTKVKGGVYGSYPSLENLDNGDLEFHNRLPLRILDHPGQVDGSRQQDDTGSKLHESAVHVMDSM